MPLITSQTLHLTIIKWYQCYLIYRTIHSLLNVWCALHESGIVSDIVDREETKLNPSIIVFVF